MNILMGKHGLSSSSPASTPKTIGNKHYNMQHVYKTEPRFPEEQPLTNILTGSNPTSVTSVFLVVKPLPMWRKKRDINLTSKVNDVSIWASRPDTPMIHTPSFDYLLTR
jgi:hypothetical protein